MYFEIRSLSSRTEDIITIVGSSGTCSSQELLSTMASGGSTAVASHSLATCHHHGQRRRFTVSGASLPISAPFGPSPPARVVSYWLECIDFLGPWLTMREREEREIKREIERERERGKTRRWRDSG